MAMISSGWMQRTSESAGDPHERERRDFGTDLDKAHEAIWKYHPGPGVNIYVFDTGIRLSHNIFSKYTGLEKKVRNFGDLKSEDQSPFCPPGWTMVSFADCLPSCSVSYEIRANYSKDDDRGHGTHVAGIAAGTANSSAFDAHIVNVKMFCESTSEQKARGMPTPINWIWPLANGSHQLLMLL
jgi:subtilisin family serine protease